MVAKRLKSSRACILQVQRLLDLSYFATLKEWDIDNCCNLRVESLERLLSFPKHMHNEGFLGLMNQDL
ncbi:hypothetical protein NL676_030901 [Syzygium grande]|nr:hypothetical protein NL676_030901 [Syzygium grande]